MLNSSPSAPKTAHPRILLIRLSSLGDVVLATAVLDHLRRLFAQAEIVLLTRSLYAELFTDDPRVTEVVVFTDAREVTSRLAKQSWEKIVDLQNNSLSRGICREIVGNKQIDVGVFDKRYLNRALLLFARFNSYDPTDSVARRYLEAADSGFGGVDVPEPSLILDDSRIPSLLPFSGDQQDRGILGFAPFAAWSNKEWPRERFSDVAAAFIQKGYSVIVFGGPEEQEDAFAFAHALGEMAVSVAGRCSLGEQAILMKTCSAFLGNDSGLVHVARSRGVPTGTIFGATTRHFGFFPYGGPPFRVFEAGARCRPCHPQGGNVCIRGNRICLKKISVEEVIQGMEQLLAPPSDARS